MATDESSDAAELNVTYTVMEEEYREAIERHGEDAAFSELEELYRAEKERREE